MGKLLHAERLAGVDARLVAVVTVAVATLPFDCSVSAGCRSREQCMINYGQGRTAAQVRAKGIPTSYAQPAAPIVTWLLDPFASRHCGGHAVDVYPLVGGALDDGHTAVEMTRFDALYHAIMAGAARTGLRVRYGGDWNENGVLRERGETDSPHFEIAA